MIATIIILDDEEGVLKALTRSLRSYGWCLKTFTDPQAALNAAASGDVDLVISDYRMPSMDGVSFLKELMAIQPDAFRIILSGQADMDGVLAAINEVGIYRFVTKPWNDAELALTIQQALGYRELLLDNRRLADLVRQQQVQIDYQKNELERLEKESPGITQIEFDADGAIVIDENDY